MVCRIFKLSIHLHTNIFIVARVIKNALPPQAKLSKESKVCIQECVSEFISFITSQASEMCVQNGRKTVNGEDVLELMQLLGFEQYSEACKIYLAKYREVSILNSKN